MTSEAASGEAMTNASDPNLAATLERVWEQLSALPFSELWGQTATHLWQSALFIGVVYLLATTMRRAPAALRHQLWTLALLKLFLPVSLFSGWALGLRGKVFGAAGVAEGSGWTDGLTTVLDPMSLVSADASSSHSGWIVVTALWLLAAGSILGWTHLRSRTPRKVGMDALTSTDRERLSTLVAEAGLDLRRIVLSPDSVMPSVRGVFRPRVWIPLSLFSALDDRHFKAVLAHEAAHVRRREPLRLWIQSVALAFFFFFPPLWLVLRRLHATAEVACDEATIAKGVEPRDLARALARTLRLGLSCPAPAAAFGSRRRSLLVERLERLQRHRRSESMRHHRLALILAGAALVATFFFPEAHAEKSPKADAIGALNGNSKSVSEESVAESEKTYPRPIPESMTPPVYPKDLEDARVEGKVLLKVAIDESGRVTGTEELQGIDGYPQFTESAQTAVLTWRFEPATEGGEAVSSAVVLPVLFKPSEEAKKQG